jgi:3-oxoacyl-[acyl-carrier-protein] synthase-1
VLPDYVNTHACATVHGDLAEWQALSRVFGERGHAVPPMSSIKGLTGHAPAAAGAIDAIASIAMMEHGVLLGGATPVKRDGAFADAPLIDGEIALSIDSVMSNTFGFGGSCAALVFRRYAGAAA